MMSDVEARRLALAIVVQAAEDARGGDENAFTWFASIGVTWLDTLGVDFMPAWLDRIRPRVRPWSFRLPHPAAWIP